jgi:hypothetical protein
MKSSHIWIIGIIIIVALVWFIAGVGKKSSAPAIAFAQCLEEKGATFYGAWWCPHCADQKAAFKGAKNHIPYIECSTPQKTQLEVCNEAQIQSYPTWEFADGTRVSGFVPLSTLASNTGCVLPEGLSDGSEVEAPAATPAVVVPESPVEGDPALVDPNISDLDEV